MSETESMSNKKKEEEVLVTKNTASIHFSNGDYFYTSNDLEAWADEVINNASFVERWLAEQDASILQIIPYVIIFSPDMKAFAYQRKRGGEARLDSKYSIGVGGHINLVDKRRKPNTKRGSKELGWATVEQGAVREVIEEINIDAQYVRENLKAVGVIYTPTVISEESATPGPTVGQVHIGVVYGLKVDTKEIKVKEEDQLVNYKFVGKPTDLDKYERWSQLILKNIDKVRELLGATTNE